MSTPSTKPMEKSDEGGTASDHSEKRVARQALKLKHKSGQFFHDYAPDDVTLDEFTRRLCTMNVYRVFFDYTTVLQSDGKAPAVEFSRHNDLNRYQDIRCLDSTRVKVPHDYLHANYVDGFRENKKFILTQAPLQKTTEQFWTMIWNEKVLMIISLTVIDGIKCARYVPTQSGQRIQFGPYSITHAGTRHVRDSYDATVLLVNKNGEPARKLLHLAFYNWPDKGTPTRPTEILYLLEDVNYNRKLLIEEAIKAKWLSPGIVTPIVVHCLAGVGRSGALVAVDICCRKLDETSGKPHGALVDVRDTVMRIRTQREMAIQKPEQYLFVHLIVVEYALRQRFYNNAEIVDMTPFMAYKQDG